MSEKFSRDVMWVEFALYVLLLPFMWGSTDLDLTTVIQADSVEVSSGIVAYALLIAPHIALARLAFTFAARGAKDLRMVADGWWLLAAAGAGIPLAALAAQLVKLATHPTIQEIASACITCVAVPNDEYGIRSHTANVVEVLSGAIWLTPLLIPLIHVWLERNRKHAL